MQVECQGQVFTPKPIVEAMWSLSKNEGRVLEPSCGDGAFLRGDRDIIAIEKDFSCAPTGALVMDFFSFGVEHKFSTVIGNPPYVRNRDIDPETRRLLPSYGFDGRSNLYLYFVRKCCEHLVDGGELVFITPRDFIKLSSAAKLNQYLNENGAFTDFVEFGDERVFGGFSPNVSVWRWVKRSTQKSVLSFFNGQFVYGGATSTSTLSDVFDVKVGAVSGADEVFASDEHGNEEFVCSGTRTSGKLRKMIYNTPCESLKPFKEKLLQRRIKTFTEENWWTWGRNYHESSKPRIYVNCKTRQKNPFFRHEARAYDGSVLALLPKSSDTDLDFWVRKLNNVDWARLGFVCGGRAIFSQRSLSNVCL